MSSTIFREGSNVQHKKCTEAATALIHSNAGFNRSKVPLFGASSGPYDAFGRDEGLIHVRPPSRIHVHTLRIPVCTVKSTLGIRDSRDPVNLGVVLLLRRYRCRC